MEGATENIEDESCSFSEKNHTLCIEFTVVIQHIFSYSYLMCKSCYFGQFIYLQNTVSAKFKSRLDCTFGVIERAHYYCQYHSCVNVK